MLTRIASLAAATAALLSSGAVTPADASDSQQQTMITIRLKHCDACSIQALQFDHDANLAYSSRVARARNGVVKLSVPTSRTEKMSFAVTAPFDDFGLPLVAVVGYGRLEAGQQVTQQFASGTHQASACWAGTAETEVRETLVVTRHPGPLAYGEGHGTVAGAYFKTTLPSLPYFVRVSDAAYHVGDPSMCA